MEFILISALLQNGVMIDKATIINVIFCIIYRTYNKRACENETL